MQKFKKVKMQNNPSVEGYACSCGCGCPCSCDCAGYQPEYSGDYSSKSNQSTSPSETSAIYRSSNL